MAGVELLLKKLPPDVRELTQHLRSAVLGVNRAIVEVPHKADIGYRRKKLFAYLLPQKEYVTIGFHAGAALTDPEKRLQGNSGPIRQVKITSKKDIDTYLRQLIRQAWEKAK